MATAFPIPAMLRAMRPKHWVKNVFVLAALVFAQRVTDPVSVLRALAAFVVFCLLSSAVYLINDIVDREADRRHPVKRRRPIASGHISVGAAGGFAVGLTVVAVGGAIALGPGFSGVACAYLLLSLAYSLALKRIVILDVMVVAAGFLLRAWAGAVVLSVAISHWLILCTGLVALFLGFVKRRQEIDGRDEERGGVTRATLRDYSLPFLDQMIAVVTSSTVLAYALYAFSAEVAEKLGTNYLGLTIPFVLFGIFRYLYLVHQRGQGENPTELVLSDRPFLINVFLWGATALIAVYVLD